MRQCTWKGREERCGKEATEQQLGKDGSVWADLCPEHHKELDEALRAVAQVAEGDKSAFPRMMSAYVKAGGGAKAMARRM